MTTLFVIATPIGNLSDLSERAKTTLAVVDAVLCEDTRVSAKIMNAISVKKPLVAYHQHSDDRRVREIIARLKAGDSLALVTDAGTPGISDPGGKLIERVVRDLGDEVAIIPIPGPNAAIAALSISGFPTDAFLFLGFPPQKNGRKSYFARVAACHETVVFYESTHRILKTLAELGELKELEGRKMVLCRELTKLHETTYRGTITEVTEKLKAGSIKGEFVVILCKNFT